MSRLKNCSIRYSGQSNSNIEPFKMFFYTYSNLVACFLIITTGISTSGQWVVEDSGCRTPDRGVGDCIPVRRCTPILKVLNDAPKPLPSNVVQLLQDYACGFDQNAPKVCCPSKPIKIDFGPPDVSQHPNRRLLPRNCGLQDVTNRIINGEQTVLFEFPWMALLKYRSRNNQEDFKCGGSIINDRYILTAAHCLTNDRLTLISVRVGEYNISSAKDCEKTDFGEVCAPPVQDLAIEEIIPHPGYNRTYNDIGLIRVSKMRFTDSVKTICLPFDEFRTYDLNSKKLTVAGWGATELGFPSKTLLKVVIETVPQGECRNIYQKLLEIKPSHICAGGKNQRDSCAGDSGGPLKVLESYDREIRYIQFGVVSFGPLICGTDGSPGVYTSVPYYMDWILNMMKP